MHVQVVSSTRENAVKHAAAFRAHGSSAAEAFFQHDFFQFCGVPHGGLNGFHKGFGAFEFAHGFSFSAARAAIPISVVIEPKASPLLFMRLSSSWT